MQLTKETDSVPQLNDKCQNICGDSSRNAAAHQTLPTNSGAMPRSAGSQKARWRFWAAGPLDMCACMELYVFWVSGLVCWMSGLVVRVSGLVFWMSGLVVRVSGLVFWASGLVFWLPGLVFRVYGLVFWVYGLVFWV